MLSAWLLAMTLGNCHLNPQELALANDLLHDADQSKAPLHCSQKLTWIARARAAMVAQRGKLSPLITPDLGVNDFLRQAGYPLASDIPGGTINTVEAITAGNSTSNAAWDNLTHSISHRDLVLRKDPFYKQYNEFGVGYVYKWYSPNIYYYVIEFGVRSHNQSHTAQ